MIIDIHTHCFPDNLASKAISTLEKKGNIPAYTDGTVNNLKQSMSKAGIKKSVILPIATKPKQTPTINRWAKSQTDKHIISFGTIHPDYTDWKKEITVLKDFGIRGVKLHPDYQGFFVDDLKLYPIYEALIKANMIILFHAGLDIGLKEPYHCTPSKLKKVLDDFPNITVIAAHMGGYKYQKEVKKYLVGKNVYFDTSYSFFELKRKGMTDIIKAHGPEKILFGTDSPWSDQKSEVLNIKSLDLDDKDISLILGENAEKLLSQ